MMAQQDVIYPSEPILIVDRQYRRKKDCKADVPTFSVQSTKRDVTISVFGREDSKAQNNIKSGASTKAKAQQCPRTGQKFEFVNATQQLKAPRPKKLSAVKRKVDPSDSDASSVTIKQSPSASTYSDKTPSQKSSALRLGGVVPNSSTTFYAYAGDHIKSNAQDLLNYCTLHER